MPHDVLPKPGLGELIGYCSTYRSKRRHRKKKRDQRSISVSLPGSRTPYPVTCRMLSAMAEMGVMYVISDAALIPAEASQPAHTMPTSPPRGSKTSAPESPSAENGCRA